MAVTTRSNVKFAPLDCDRIKWYLKYHKLGNTQGTDHGNHRRNASGLSRPGHPELWFPPLLPGGSIWAAAAMALFIPMLQGNLALPTALNPIDWHQHELLYGFLPAIVAGFLLTAVPNWTGRLPVAGAPLAALFALWLLGRAAVAYSALIGAGAAAAVDILFLIALGIIAGREIWASGNKNNLKILVLVSLLAVGNLIFHVEAWTSGTADYGKRIGIAVAILLISVIGGRIVPSFTRNWLAKKGPDALPAPFGRFDVVAIASSAIALAAWIVAPASLVTAAACGIAGVVHFVRLARWRGYRNFCGAVSDDPACRLSVRACRLSSHGSGDRVPRRCCAGRGCSCVDGGRHRRHDAGRYDAREPRSYGA